MVNLAQKPEYHTILVQHRAYLTEWGKKTHDSFTPSR
jgi:hypothetical protein